MTDIPSMAADLIALGQGGTGKALVQLRAARDQLQKAILAGANAVPPTDTEAEEEDFGLVNSWIRALETAISASPPAGADRDLLNAMQAVDAAAAQSAALNAVLTSVDGAVKAAKRAKSGG